MLRRELTVVLLLVCLLNGLFSPLVWVMWQTAPLWMPDFLMRIPGALFFVTPLVLALLTFLCSGVPAALYERLTGQRESTATSLGIWLGTAIVLSLPAAWTLAMVM